MISFLYAIEKNYHFDEGNIYDQSFWFEKNYKI